MGGGKKAIHSKVFPIKAKLCILQYTKRMSSFGLSHFHRLCLLQYNCNGMLIFENVQIVPKQMTEILKEASDSVSQDGAAHYYAVSLGQSIGGSNS